MCDNKHMGCQIKCGIEVFKNNVRTIYQTSGNSLIFMNFSYFSQVDFLGKKAT